MTQQTGPARIGCAIIGVEPMGMGLFTTGMLVSCLPKNPSVIPQRFTWCYDCGSMHLSQNEMQARIDRAFYGGHIENDTIDLLVISHFDKDHINGLPLLLKKYRIRHLVLPYVSMVERVRGMVDEEWDADLTHLQLQPVQHLRSNYEGRIDNIHIYVGDEPGDDGPPPETFDNVDGPPKLDIPQSGEAPGPTEQEPIEPGVPWAEGYDYSGTPSSSVSYMRSQRPWRLGPWWEFKFYNPQTRRSVSQLSLLVRKAYRVYMAKKTEQAWTEFMKVVRKSYSATFGKGGKAKNRISLTMFSGAVHQKSQIISSSMLANGAVTWRDNCHLRRIASHSRCHVPSLLMTGDGDVTTDKWTTYEQYFGPQRLDRMMIFQIPHHGSKHNWEIGMGEKLKHFEAFVTVDGKWRHQIESRHPSLSILKDIRRIDRLVRISTENDSIYYGFSAVWMDVSSGISPWCHDEFPLPALGRWWFRHMPWPRSFLWEHFSRAWPLWPDRMCGCWDMRR